MFHHCPFWNSSIHYPVSFIRLFILFFYITNISGSNPCKDSSHNVLSSCSINVLNASPSIWLGAFHTSSFLYLLTGHHSVHTLSRSTICIVKLNPLNHFTYICLTLSLHSPKILIIIQCIKIAAYFHSHS